MITKPILLDETGQKILSAIQRIKNKLMGTTTDPITPGTAGDSGVKAIMQDDTGRDVISALNDVADKIPRFTDDGTTIDTNGNLSVQGAGLFGNSNETQTMIQLTNSQGSMSMHKNAEYRGIYDHAAAAWLLCYNNLTAFTDCNFTAKQNIMVQSASDWPEINFSKITDASRGGALTKSTDANTNRFYFQHYHRSGGVNNSYVDIYYLPPSGSDDANHYYDILTTKGYSMGNWTHPNAGQSQYQKAVVNRYVTGSMTWDGVSGAQLTAPVEGIYVVTAFAAYNNSEPSGVAINVRGANQSYNNFSAVTDRTSCGLGIGTTQYLRTTYVGWMGAGDVAIPFVRYASAAYNNVGLEMWLL